MTHDELVETVNNMKIVIFNMQNDMLDIYKRLDRISDHLSTPIPNSPIIGFEYRCTKCGMMIHNVPMGHVCTNMNCPTSWTVTSTGT